MKKPEENCGDERRSCIKASMFDSKVVFLPHYLPPSPEVDEKALEYWNQWGKRRTSSTSID